MTTETTSGHFVVEGEWLTEHCRSLWADEDRADHALRTLDCIPGMTLDQKMSILEGRYKLTGDSDVGMELVPDKQRSERRKLPTLLEQMKKLKDERDEAKEEVLDQAEMANGDTVGLGSPTGLRMVPRRRTKVKSTGRRALADNLEFDDVLRDNPEPGVKPLRVWRETTPMTRAAVVKDTVFPFSRKPATLEETEDETEDKAVETPPKGEKYISTNTGWLSPTGLFYPCDYAEHRELAELLGGEPGSLTGPHLHNAERDLELKGWVKVCVNGNEQFFHGFYGFSAEEKKVKPTEAQRNRVRDYCLEHQTRAKTNTDLPHCSLPPWVEEE